jgi:hypothetical protein
MILRKENSTRKRFEELLRYLLNQELEGKKTIQLLVRQVALLTKKEKVIRLPLRDSQKIKLNTPDVSRNEDMAKQENNKEYIMERIHDLEKALESLQATYQIALKKIEELCDDKQEMRQEIFKLKGMYEQSAK